MEAVVNSTFVDCDICDQAFAHIVEVESEVTICLTGGRTPTRSKTEASIGRAQGPEGLALRALPGSSVTVVTTGLGQDPLEAYRVRTRPTVEQLTLLDKLLDTERTEPPFQRFLEENPELLLVGVELGHHGYYVLS